MSEIVPWNAATYFADPTKWEVIQRDGSVSWCVPNLTLDGSIATPEYWEGMRRKTRKVEVFVALCESNINGVTPYANADRNQVEKCIHRITPVHSVIIEIDDA
jgi:hypothetical protein